VFGDPLEGAVACAREDVLGAAPPAPPVLPHERRTLVLLAIAARLHLATSLGWAAVMAAALPHGREPAPGVVSGMPIATLDLALIARRMPSIATLPQGPPVDHAAYGLAVGLVLRARRSRRTDGPARHGARRARSHATKCPSEFGGLRSDARGSGGVDSASPRTQKRGESRSPARRRPLLVQLECAGWAARTRYVTDAGVLRLVSTLGSDR
jgi:hypothetical protein